MSPGLDTITTHHQSKNHMSQSAVMTYRQGLHVECIVPSIYVCIYTIVHMYVSVNTMLSFCTQNKKTRDSMSVAVPPLTSALDLQSPDSGLSPTPAKSYPIPDYKELRNCKIGSPSSSGQKAVPNDYVPAPPEMEQFRGRAYTVGVCQPSPAEVPLRRIPENLVRRDSMNTYTTYDDDARSTRSNSSNLHQSQHLSVISMESGLSFGYDVEINPNLPLEVQPWFHGKLARDDAVALLNEEGDFLVRENTTLANTFTLSMYWRGRCDHTLIQCDEVVNSRNGTTVKYSFDGGAFDSIPELIHHHLKYQIPISKDAQNLLMTPIHRQGAKVPFTPAGYYQPAHDRGERGHSTSTGRSSPSSVRSVSDDHMSHRSFSKRSSSPEVVRQYRRPHRSSSMSPGASSVSPRQSPARDIVMRGSNSSGELLEEEEVDQAVRPRNAISPLPGMGVSVMRSRAMTDSKLVRGAGGGGGTRDSFGDYEVMESVSLLGSPPSQRKATITATPHSANPSPAPVRTWVSGGDVKYAEIQHTRKPRELSRRVSYSGHQHTCSTPSSSGAKYAEVRFQRRQQSQPNVSPHPFSVYDTVQSSPTRVNPYQSRAEVLAQKLQSEPTARASSPAHQRLNRTESSPLSISHHSTHSLPRHASSPLVMEGISEETTTTPTPQSDAKIHSLPDRVRRRVHTISQSSLASEDLNAGKEGQSVPAQVPKSLPGHGLLVGLHDLLGRSTEMELAYHLTRADAVAFLLTPRPGEDKEVWKER